MTDMNPYYDPESLGLTIVTSGDDPEAFYSFDMFVVWTDGKDLFYGQDSGCSCPTPFDEFEPEKATGKQQIYRAIDRWADGGDERWHRVAIELKDDVRAWRASHNPEGNN